MNPKLPKDGSLDGVLSRNPDPLPPLGYSSMEAYYKAQRKSRGEEE